MILTKAVVQPVGERSGGGAKSDLRWGAVELVLTTIQNAAVLRFVLGPNVTLHVRA